MISSNGICVRSPHDYSYLGTDPSNLRTNNFSIHHFKLCPFNVYFVNKQKANQIIQMRVNTGCNTKNNRTPLRIRDTLKHKSWPVHKQTDQWHVRLLAIFRNEFHKTNIIAISTTGHHLTSFKKWEQFPKATHSPISSSNNFLS